MHLGADYCCGHYLNYWLLIPSACLLLCVYSRREMGILSVQSWGSFTNSGSIAWPSKRVHGGQFALPFSSPQATRESSMPARAPPPAPSLMLVSAGLFPLHFFFHSSLPQLLYSTFLPFLNMLLQKHHHHAGQAYLCLVSIGAIWSYLCSAWGSPGLSSQPPTTKTWTYEPSNTGRMMCS